MNVKPPPIVLPDMDDIRRQIAYHDAEATGLRKLLRLMLRMEEAKAAAEFVPSAPLAYAGACRG